MRLRLMAFEDMTEPYSTTPTPPPYTIRALGPADMAAYHALRLEGLERNPEAFGETAENFRAVSPQQLAERLTDSMSRGGFTLAAIGDSDRFVGTVSLARLSGEKMLHRGLIWGMYVTPNNRRHGIGRALVEECLRRASLVPGLQQVHLSVVTENTSACELYQSLGFASYGTEPRALKIGPRYYDEYLMFKILHP